jgi:hypothetical protein
MLGLWLIDHPEFLTDAREREDAVRPASLPDHHQLESSGMRSFIRSKDRPHTRRIKEGETSQVEYDPTGRGNFEEAGERIFDAADSRQVELVARAQEQSAPLLLDGKLKAICRWHGRLNSPAPLQSGDQGRRGRKDPRARAALHATPPAPCPKPGSSNSPAKSTNPEPAQWIWANALRPFRKATPAHGSL